MSCLAEPGNKLINDFFLKTEEQKKGLNPIFKDEQGGHLSKNWGKGTSQKTEK